MGTDIHGGIEVYDPRLEKWYYCGRLLPHVGRSYDTFGLLFGVRNFPGFNSPFAGRGLPESEDRSRGLDDRLNEYEKDNAVGSIICHSPTWVTLDELQALDWDDEAEELDQRISVLDENGEPTGTKFGWASVIDELSDDELAALDDGDAVPHPGDGHGGFLQRQRLTRRDAFSGAWEWLIFEYLPVLADRHGGDENVRLTVWFDN